LQTCSVSLPPAFFHANLLASLFSIFSSLLWFEVYFVIPPLVPPLHPFAFFFFFFLLLMKKRPPFPLSTCFLFLLLFHDFSVHKSISWTACCPAPRESPTIPRQAQWQMFRCLPHRNFLPPTKSHGLTMGSDPFAGFANLSLFCSGLPPRFRLGLIW